MKIYSSWIHVMSKGEHEGLMEVKEVGQWVCECGRLSVDGSC